MDTERLTLLAIDLAVTCIPAILVYKIARMDKSSRVFAALYLFMNAYFVFIGLVSIIDTSTTGMDGNLESIYWMAANLLLRLALLSGPALILNLIVTMAYSVRCSRRKDFKSRESALYFLSFLSSSAIAGFYFYIALMEVIHGT